MYAYDAYESDNILEFTNGFYRIELFAITFTPSVTLKCHFQLMKCTTGPVYKIQHISPKKLIQRPVELIFLLPRSNGSDVQSQLWSLSSLVATKW